MDKQDQKEFYDEIIRFFDLAEDIINTIQREESHNPELEVQLAVPVIEQVNESATILSETYLDFLKSGEKATSSDIRKVETALRKIFSTVINFINELDKIPSNIKGASDIFQKYMENRKKKLARILSMMVKNHESLYQGPNQALMMKHSARLPDISPLIHSVNEVGVHTMMVGRAFNHPSIQLVSDINKIEPGAVLTGKLDKEKNASPDRDQELGF